MSWLSSFLGGVEKDVIRPIAPTLLTAVGVAGAAALTGGAALGSASILTAFGALSGGSAASGSSSAVNPAMGLQSGTAAGTQPSLLTGGQQPSFIAGEVGGIENYLSAASHNIVSQGVRFGIFIVIILFMLGAFVALLLPDEQQSINIAKIAEAG